MVEVSKNLGMGTAAIRLTGAGIGIGLVFAALLNAVARNPALRGQLFSYAILGFAFVEAIGLFDLMVALMAKFVSITRGVLDCIALSEPYSDMVSTTDLNTSSIPGRRDLWRLPSWSHRLYIRGRGDEAGVYEKVHWSLCAATSHRIYSQSVTWDGRVHSHNGIEALL